MTKIIDGSTTIGAAEVQSFSDDLLVSDAALEASSAPIETESEAGPRIEADPDADLASEIPVAASASVAVGSIEVENLADPEISDVAEAPVPSGFSGFGLSPEILAGLEAIGFQEPSPIQKAAIPELLLGRDLVGQAQTGTGKTAA
ncbi:MAG: DEAD/DEAH box helicase, partial [Cyanobacteriota bacterium]